MKFLAFVVFLQCLVLALAQESINAFAGLNIGMHVGLSIGICFSILAICAVSINLLHKKCGKRGLE